MMGITIQVFLVFGFRFPTIASAETKYQEQTDETLPPSIIIIIISIISYHVLAREISQVGTIQT